MRFALPTCHGCYKAIFIGIRVSFLGVASLDVKHLRSLLSWLDHPVDLVERCSDRILYGRSLVVVA